MSSSVDLLLHPVRLRIVQAFLGERELTTGDLRRLLPEVAAATLYRQVAALVDGRVLAVTAERRVRGAVERTYRLQAERASVTPEDLAEMTPADHRAAFFTFVAGLLADFDRYVAAGDIDLVRDRVGYRQAGFYATDAELDELLAVVSAALVPLLDSAATPERRRRLLTTVLMPGAAAEPS